MSSIAINDLHTHRDLNRKAMTGIRGAGAGWVYGWIRPYVEASSSFASTVNFYQTNNYYSADQMNIQVEVIDINNSGINANINVNAKQQSINFKQA